jgi:cytochrome c oxidase subunit 2
MSTSATRRIRWTTTALAASAVLLAACNGTTSYLDATGTAGREEAVLGDWLTAVACVVVVAVCVAIVWGIARRRDESDAGTGRREVKSGLNWIYIGSALTLVTLLVTFAGTMVTLNAASHPPRTPSLAMDVIAHQWWWEVRYRDPAHPGADFTTANEVHLPVGEPVHVRLQSADVIHSFWLPQIAGKTDVIPGQTNEMWIEARRPGSSRGMCGEYCGLQHAMMALPVTAEPPRDFEAWASERRAEAIHPAGVDAHNGEIVFTRTCGACHSVMGTNALGKVGPDLTHFASRPLIGAGVLLNTPTNLARWITAAPAIKEGARMPAISLDPTELRSVVAYLETLR